MDEEILHITIGGNQDEDENAILSGGCDLEDGAEENDNDGSSVVTEDDEDGNIQVVASIGGGFENESPINEEDDQNEKEVGKVSLGKFLRIYTPSGSNSSSTSGGPSDDEVTSNELAQILRAPLYLKKENTEREAASSKSCPPLMSQVSMGTLFGMAAGFCDRGNCESVVTPGGVILGGCLFAMQVADHNDMYHFPWNRCCCCCSRSCCSAEAKARYQQATRDLLKSCTCFSEKNYRILISFLLAYTTGRWIGS